MKIKLSADSAMDIPQELSARCGFSVIPGTIILGDTEYKDGMITPADLFEFSDKGGATRTAAINESEYTEFFKQLLKDSDVVIHICQSSGISISCQNAMLAAEGKPVHIVDSHNLSSAGALLALRGWEMVRDGMDPEQIAEALRAMTPKLETSFILDTLKYMRRGGRCSAVAALGANVLKLKPCIEMRADIGKMDVGKKYRGNLETVLLQYVEERLKGRNDIDTRTLFVTHTELDDAIVSKVKEKAAEYIQFDEVIEATASCTISNHSGPGTLGLLYVTK